MRRRFTYDLLCRYLGNERFVVERADNAKIKVGNHIRCDVFRAGQPLYLDVVEPRLSPSPTYNSTIDHTTPM